jgi:hypothetical protein
MGRRMGAPITPGALRSVVALFVLVLGLAAANLLFTVSYVGAANHKFCQVVSAVTADPVQQPGAAAAPSQVRQYQLYEQFLLLGRSLGC